LRRVPAGSPDRLDHGIGRLNAPGFLQLPQIAASVISGRASVTMILTSIATAQKRLKDRPRSRPLRFVLLRFTRLRQIEPVPCQRDHQVGIVAHAQKLDRTARAEATLGIGAKRPEPFLIGRGVHVSFYQATATRSK
jgi:hypothetical protein